MKRKKILCLLFVLMFSMTGCATYNADMNIKKDKSMDLKIIYAFDNDVLGEQSLLSDIDKIKLKENNFEVTDYIDKNKRGFIISKNISNIDMLSSSDDTEYSLSKLIEYNDLNKYIFSAKKGLFKNTYVAKFIFNPSDSEFIMNNDELLSDPMDEDFLDEDFLDEDFDDGFSDDSSTDLSFNLRLPYASINNNATEVTDGGKNLKWELASSEISFIEFEFELYNFNIIYISVGIALVLLVFLIAVIKNKRKSLNS